MVRFLMPISYVVLFGLSAFAAEELPQSFTLDGRLYSDSAATIPMVDLITMKVQILNPAQTCILYEETQSVDTRTSSGYYTIQIGQKASPPAGKRSSGDANNILTGIFSNTLTSVTGKLLSDGTTACTYTPTSGDVRFARFTVTPAGDNLPRTTTTNLRIDAVPYALVAERAENLRGYTPSQFLQVNGTTASLTQANLESLFSVTSYSRMSSLVSVPATDYVTKASNGSIGIVSVASDPVTGLAAGQIWYNTTTNTLKYYDAGSSSVKSLASAGSSSQWTTSGSDIYFSTGKVGIGTSSPSSTLAVAETSGTVAVGVGISHTGVSGSAGAGLSITDNTVGSAANGLYSEKTTAGGSGVYGYSSAQGGSSGVGVTGISSGTSAGVGVYASANGVGNVGYALQAVNNSATGWSVYVSGSSPSYFGSNVGIGTTTPASRLEVKGTTADNSAYSFVARDSGNASTFRIRNDGYFDNSGSFNLGASGAGGTIYAAGFSRLSGPMIYDSAGSALTLGASSASTVLTLNSTGNVGIGTTSPSVALDLSAKTDGVRMPNGTTAQQVTCNSGAAGVMRYNSTTTFMEYCDGTSWVAMPKVQSAIAPTVPAGAGYIVLTNTTWDGNLGGLTGANAKCLTELGTTYTNWMGYTDANTRGLLVGAKVKAVLCDQVTCNNLIPLATYYFAVANQPAVGGASFTADSSGFGPNDSAVWSAANRFNGTATYWMNRGPGSGIIWSGGPYDTSAASTCSSFSTNSIVQLGRIGSSGYGDINRWRAATPTCDTPARLLCIVNP